MSARDAFVAAMQAAPTLAGVNIYTHGGSFDLDELNTFSRKAPSLVIALLRFDADIQGGIVSAHARWGLIGFTRDTKSGAATVPRDRSCVDLLEAACAVILRTFGGAGVRGRGREFTARNLFGRKLDATTNIAMWGAEFQQDLDLTETIESDAWLRMGLTWDLYPRDNDAPLSDLPEAEDLIEPEQ
jgi:hypothetical protein